MKRSTQLFACILSLSIMCVATNSWSQALNKPPADSIVQLTAQPDSLVLSQFLLRACNTRCLLQAGAGNYVYVLNGDMDRVEYCMNSDGIGPRTGGEIYFDSDGALDPYSGVWIRGVNVTEYVHKNGKAYEQLSRDQTGKLFVPLGDAGHLSSPTEGLKFIGIGSRIQFDRDEWVQLGGKSYRSGGFEINTDGIHFLESTELKLNDKIYRFEGAKWNLIK